MVTCAGQPLHWLGEPNHRHSVRELIGYGIEATDDAIGRVADFIVDAQAPRGYTARQQLAELEMG